MGVYRYNFKSEEQRGASQPNSITIGADDDGAANASSGAFAALVSGDLLSITREDNPAYARPYPVGTGWTVRCIGRDANDWPYTFWGYNWDDTQSSAAFAAALVAAGAADPFTGHALVTMDVTPVHVTSIHPV